LQADSPTGPTDLLTLDATEPLYTPSTFTGLLDSAYVGATLALTDGPGAGQTREILGDSRTSNIVEVAAVTGTPDATTQYTITFPHGTETAGFLLRQAPVTFPVGDPVPGDFVTLTTVYGVSYSMPADAGPYHAAFELVPVNTAGQANYQGAWRVLIHVQGQVPAPDPPAEE
jgi:hypothetical protein